MRKIKIAILVSIILIGLFVGVHLMTSFQTRKAGEESPATKISDGDADARLEKIRFVEDKRGQRTWELEATAVEQYQNQNTLLLQDVKVTFFMKDGRSVVLSGDRGKVFQDSRNMQLTGNVVLTTSDGYRLKTQSISYDHAKAEVSTSDPVEIEGEQMHLVGKGMLVDIEARTFKVLSQVKTLWRGGKV
ncbi:MAG: LPS export ABC transporter periplasmic protein LptC [Deltaproteobacteria bacterium RBG_13_53_10]|nr:MAG: LPS export ABC transporter periplasmic protein LptC [Deltaproteobacteria bacterium RBG_13_53_10]